MLLLTYHGNLLCFDKASHQILQVPIDDVREPVVPVEIEVEARTHGDRFRQFLLEELPADPPAIHEGPLAYAALAWSEDKTALTINSEGCFFCAIPGQRHVLPERREVSSWEQFVPITHADLELIRYVCTHDWVLKRRSTIARRADVRLGPGWTLNVGPVAADVRFNLPLLRMNAGKRDLSKEPSSLTLLVEGWKIEEVLLYRPLVYYTAFGSDSVLEQLRLSLRSLIEFGSFDGDVIVFTDLDRSRIAELEPTLKSERLKIVAFAAKDWTAYVGSKYLICDEPDAFSYQPIMFLDPDLVIDAPVAPILASVRCADRISAQLEHWTYLGTCPSVGASLIQRDGWSPRYSAGVNGGALGIPTLSEHAASLELVRTIITNHATIFGRNFFRWVDQEVLNYVSFRGANFDTQILSACIRTGFEGAEHDTTKRVGMVHFWPGYGIPKEVRMKTYIDELRKHPLPEHRLPGYVLPD